VTRSRRHLLRAAAAAAGVGLAGCTGDGASSPGAPDGARTTAAPCERAFDERADTDACAGVGFESVQPEPVSTATTEPGETPYEGTFSDRLAVTVTTDERSRVVRGCVLGSVDGETVRRPVTRTLPAEGTTHRFTVGPFDHPGGVSEYHLWIRGCDASVRR
jgi:hypothetical protein